MKFAILLLLATSAQAAKLMAGRANHKQLAQVKSVKAMKLSQLKHKQEDDDEASEDDDFDNYAQVKSKKALKLSQLKHKEGQYSDEVEVDVNDMFADYAQVKSKKALKLSQLKHKQEDDDETSGDDDEASEDDDEAALAQVSTKQPPTPDDAFGALDLDNNGMITEDEAMSAVEAGTITKDDVEHFGEFVGDDDQLSMDEYYKGLAALAQVSTKKAVKLSQLKTKAKQPTWEQITAEADTNKDGSISLEEFKTFASKAGLGADDVAVFEDGAGEDGSLNEEEFNALLASLAQVSTKKAVKLSQLKTKAKEITWAELTAFLDVNKDASISVEEIEKAPDLTAEDMAAFKEFAGEDGSLNEEEFNALIASFG